MVNNKKPLHQIVSEKVLNVFYSRINPFKNINFVTNSYSKRELGLEHLGDFAALKEVKRRVNEVVAATGVSRYKGRSIWDIPIWEMKDALPLIKHGIVQKDDFNYSPISKIKYPKQLTWLDKPDDIYNRLKNEEPLFKEIARKVAKTQKEFEDLFFGFNRYKNHVYRIADYTDQIAAKIERYTVVSYNGISLYDITDIEILAEAFKALQLMHFLKKEYYITHYQGKSIEDLNLYTLKNIESKADKNDFEDCIINKPAELVKELTAIADPAKEQQEKKALQAMIKRIVQAELKKAQGELSVKKSIAKPIKKASTKTIKKQIKS